MWPDVPTQTRRAVGLTLSGAKQHHDAIEVLELSARLCQNSSRAYQGLGEAHATARQSRSAIRTYERSLEIDPRNEVSKVALVRLRGRKAP